MDTGLLFGIKPFIILSVQDRVITKRIKMLKLALVGMTLCAVIPATLLLLGRIFGGGATENTANAFGALILGLLMIVAPLAALLALIFGIQMLAYGIVILFASATVQKKDRLLAVLGITVSVSLGVWIYLEYIRPGLTS